MPKIHILSEVSISQHHQNASTAEMYQNHDLTVLGADSVPVHTRQGVGHLIQHVRVAQSSHVQNANLSQCQSNSRE